MDLRITFVMDEIVFGFLLIRKDYFFMDVMDKSVDLLITFVMDGLVFWIR